MPIDGWVLAMLVGTAFVAGWVDAVVGGGGLVQLPALLLGLPDNTGVAAASGTNKVSSIAGTSMAALSYLRRLTLSWRLVVPLVASAAIGSMAGASVVRFVPKASVLPLLLLVMVAMWVYTWRRPAMGMTDGAGSVSTYAPLRMAGIGGVVGTYDGFLGPGTGTFFILSLVAFLGMGWLHASAYAKLANFATNASAIAVFAVTGNIVWLVALPMACANFVGGLLGASIAMRRGNRFVRGVFLVVVAALIVRVGIEVVGHLSW